MSDAFSDTWEKDYLKKADKYEKICLKEDKLGFEYDLQASSMTPEYACVLLKKISIASKALSVFFFLVILVAHHTSEHSGSALKFDEGYFENIYPVKVNK